MSDTRLKIAVFIDFDNIEIGVKTTLNQPFDISAILEALKERGEVVTKVAYGDWKRAGDFGRQLSQHAIRLVQRNLTPGGDKNGADINLALDALEMVFTHAHINAFVIVGGDSDFITLVEKLKQYDKKVFVVGGRQFTSQVMQKNCHEFIAYENLVSSRRSSSGRRSGPSAIGSADVAKALPLVKRALKVLVDREVSPQLGLLKSTLLQLDSTFSERDYGASTFRAFMEKVAATGVVALHNAGRSTLVELAEGSADALEPPPAAGEKHSRADGARHEGARLDGTRLEGTDDAAEATAPPPAETNGGGQELVARVRELCRGAAQSPRWPMYVRQVKQYLRTLDESFDERKAGFGSLVEFLRACQREGLFRLERTGRGVLRVFPGGGLAAEQADTGPASTSNGSPAVIPMVPPEDVSPADALDASGDLEAMSTHAGQPASPDAAPAEASDAPAVEPGEAGSEPEAKPRPKRARKTTARKTAPKSTGRTRKRAASASTAGTSRKKP